MIQDKKEQYKKTIADNKGVDFYERTKLRYQNFPGEFDNNLQYVLLEAGRLTQEYLYIATNTDHEKHSEYAKEYAIKFECRPEKVADHFRQIELDNYAIDKAGTIKDCKEKGTNKAQHFIGSLLDSNHAYHTENIATFKTRYNSVPDQIENDFIIEELRKKGYKSVPNRDTDYEKSLTADTSKLNPFQLCAFKSLKELFELKWQVAGTIADDLIFEQFAKENVTIPTLSFTPRH
jgi:hypothetical protein